MSVSPSVLDREHYLARAKELPLFQTLGLEIVDLKPGWSRCRIGFRPDLCQPAGILHGGIVATLVDTGIAHALLLTDAVLESRKDGGYIVSVDLRIKYFRPVSAGELTCDSTITRTGRQLSHGESVVVNSDGKEVARGDSIYMIVRPERR